MSNSSAIDKNNWDFARQLTTYRREPAVQALLDLWRFLPARSALHKAKTMSGVPNEALVAVARELVRHGAQSEAWTVVELIVDRTAGRTYKHLSIWGMSSGPACEDATREILHMMSEAILSLSPRCEFWECRFWTCFDRRVRTLLRDMARSRSGDEPWDDAVENAPRVADVDWTDSLVARIALNCLPEPVRTAYYLKNYAGYKEESRDSEPTIASTLQVSGRTVRNYLQRAEQLLAVWRNEELGDV